MKQSRDHLREGHRRYGFHISVTKWLFRVIVGCGLLIANVSYGNPEGGQVVAGQATISSPNSSTVQVNQTSDKAVIDWRSFNISPSETTQFHQPAPSSIALNRINPQNGVSTILGHLSANGQIWLLNPAGIIFGSTARVDVAGLLATTAWISTSDFMSGNYHFIQPPNWNGGIVNEGTISVSDEGLVALVAPGVENSGVIQANLGKVVLAAGNEFTVDFYGDELINFGLNATVTAPATDPRTNQPMRDAVRNSGKIYANGGKVLLTAKTAKGVLDNAINMTGYVEAKAVAKRGGDVVLLGGNEGIVKVSGRINVAGKKAGQTGGTVKILGKSIYLTNSAKINASGYAGGGIVLVGGNAMGLGPEMNASYAYVSPSALINASALMNGNGGKVIVWSNIATQFYGMILAQGGLYSGNGGWVETSGKYLDVAGARVNTLAPKGITGSWLLDPADITISDITQTSNSALNGTSYQPNSGVASSNIYSGDLGNALHTTNITVTTTNNGSSGGGNGDITVSGVANLQNGWLSGDTTTLTLNADRNIIINTPITLLGSGKGLTLSAGNTTATGTISINNALNGSFNLTLSTQATGSITIGAALGALTPLTSVTATGGTAATGTNINANVTTTGAQTYNNPVTMGASATLTGGTITMPAVALGSNTLSINTTSASSAITGIISGTSGSLATLGTGTLTLSAANTYTGATTIGGPLKLNGNGTATSTAITINLGGVLTLDNSGTNNTNRISDSNALTMNGGELVVIGNSGANTTESIGALTLNSGDATITLTPNAAKNTQVTFASLARTAGATALFRGINLGANTVASQTANSSNIVFTAAPTLTGAGNSGTTTVGIIAGAVGAGGASGNTNSATDFVTYNPPTGAVNGLRPLAAAEYASAAATNVNLKLTANASPDASFTINSLLLSGGGR